MNRVSTYFLAFLFLFSSTLFSAEKLPEALMQVGVSENIKGDISGDFTFTDSSGRPFSFSDLLSDGKPVILNFAYYTCPMLCHLVTGGLADGISKSKLALGSDYRVLTVSIDPQDTTANAREFKKKILGTLPNFDEDSWLMSISDAETIKNITDVTGFKYTYNANTKQFAHSAVLIMVNPDSRISRYLYGIEFKPFDLRMAVLESERRDYISAVDSVLLFCYNYDPQTRGYVLYAWNLMKVVGGLTVFGIILLWFKLKK